MDPVQNAGSGLTYSIRCSGNGRLGPERSGIHPGRERSGLSRVADRLHRRETREPGIKERLDSIRRNLHQSIALAGMLDLRYPAKSNSRLHPPPKYQMDLIMFCVQNTYCEWAFCECIKIIHLRP